MTSYLTLLLATLGIMIGLFTVTGFINRMGATLLDLGAWNIMAMIFMAYIFGWLVGAGLPPTATYIIGAVIIVQPLVNLGVNPWVAHFFVFLLSVWGELSPPTSLTAAVSARIAEASFMKTMWEALKICLPITLMTFAIFTRSNMVVTTGWPQIVDTLLVMIGTCGDRLCDVRPLLGADRRGHRIAACARGARRLRAVPSERPMGADGLPALRDRDHRRHPAPSACIATRGACKRGSGEKSGPVGAGCGSQARVVTKGCKEKGPPNGRPFLRMTWLRDATSRNATQLYSNRAAS